VAALQVATNQRPTVAGKPERALLETAMQRTGARRPLVVGDRLDTDIAGARAAGLECLLVLSGVSDAAAVLAAPPQQRPDHLGADLRVLRRAVEECRIQVRPGWRVDCVDGTLLLHSNGAPGDPLDALRTLCATWWAGHSGPVQVRPGDETAARVLAAVGLA
jgi:glycerol 3-phosphatase-2